VRCAAAWALSVMGDNVGLDTMFQLLRQRGEHVFPTLRALNQMTRQNFSLNAEGVEAACRWLRMRKGLSS